MSPYNHVPDHVPPMFCSTCGLPIGQPHQCTCKRITVRVPRRLEGSDA